MQTKRGMILIGARRIHLSLLITILVVAAITANLLIWERNATRVPVRVSIDIQQTRPALDQHERHPSTHGIAENTFYRWRKVYGGMSVNKVQRLKELEKEHARLKRLLAERDLEADALKPLLAKNRDHR